MIIKRAKVDIVFPIIGDSVGKAITFKLSLASLLLKAEQVCRPMFVPVDSQRKFPGHWPYRHNIKSEKMARQKANPKRRNEASAAADQVREEDEVAEVIPLEPPPKKRRKVIELFHVFYFKP